jgi:hypothetical protein
MDTVAHDLYGPKLAAGWGVSIALQGPAGSANVQYTPWYATGSWSMVTNFGINDIYYNLAVPALSASIINSGTILVYAQLNLYTEAIWPQYTVAQLPITITYNYNSKSQVDVWQDQLAPGNVYLQLTNNNNVYAADEITSVNIRVVLIPGGVAIPAGIGYKELKKYPGVDIPD